MDQLINTNLASTKPPKEKPFEMNTYIQLEMDNNNCNCVPRLCKFLVSKLSLQTDLASVILAVKLEVSKRSLRTIEIPIVKQTQQSSNKFADLCLNYSITYPHFLKKDTNILYFYIQRRKKYKTRTILGYKTLAYTFIDLASVLQRPFSKDLPLFLNTSVHGSNRLSQMTSSTGSKTIIGHLRIQTLVSQPIELSEVDGLSLFKNNTDNILKNEIDDELDEFDELNEYSKTKELADSYLTNLKLAAQSDSDNENEENLKKTTTKENNSNSKKITGKIISFIRKLRNDNDANNLEAIQNEDNIMLNDEFDAYDIEQVTDYSDSEGEQDAYSIVSTPKPKLQPFFTNSKYLEDNFTRSSHSKLDTAPSEASTELQRKLSFRAKLSFAEETLNEVFKKPDLLTDSVFVLVDENDPLGFDLSLENMFLVKTASEMRCLMDNLAKKLNIQTVLKLVVMGNDQFLNKYTQSYIELIKANENIQGSMQHYFIPRNKSIMGSYLGRMSPVYSSLFCDDFWANVEENSGMGELECRIQKYVGKKESSSIGFQIGEACIDVFNSTQDIKPKIIPFLTDIRIGFPSSNPAEHNLDLESIRLNASNSIQLSSFVNPQHNNVNDTSGLNSPTLDHQKNDRYFQYTSYLNTNRSSPPNSPLAISSAEDLGYNLQMDYWSIGSNMSATFSTPAMLSSLNGSVNKETKESEKSKGNKTNVKALFKSLHIYRTSFVKLAGQNSTGLSSEGVNEGIQNNLTLMYVIKEKKQKIMRLSKKSKESEHKETIEGLTKLVCTSRNHNIPLNVFIDDVEYNNVKFLQISTLWQGKVKQLNIVVP